MKHAKQNKQHFAIQFKWYEILKRQSNKIIMKQNWKIISVFGTKNKDDIQNKTEQKRGFTQQRCITRFGKRHHLKYMMVVHVAAIKAGTAASMQAAAATRRSSDVLTTYVRTLAKHYLRGKYISSFFIQEGSSRKGISCDPSVKCSSTNYTHCHTSVKWKPSLFFMAKATYLRTHVS